MKIIPNHIALKQVSAKQAVLIDVREPAEFYEGHLPGAINLPASKFSPEDYQNFPFRPIYLICNSGSRAKQIATSLAEQNFSQIFLLEEQMETLNEAQIIGQTETQAPQGWSIDRQFRMTLGFFLLIFLLGYTFVSAFFLIIPLILCTGLIYTAIIDRCYLRMGIAMLPWNRKRGQEAESQKQGLEFVPQTQ